MTLPPPRWKKSGHSSSSSSCVEIDGATMQRVRDSKNPDGPGLSVRVDLLIAAVKAGLVDGR